MTAHVVLPVAIIVACASAWPASYGVSNEGMTQAPTLSSPVSRERQTSGSAAISGVVLDAVTGQPIANATVNVDSGLRVTSTDAKGRFVLLNLPPSPAAGYLLQASKIGYLQDGEGQAQARRGQRVVVRDGEWFSQVRLELVRLGSITGTVIDEHGAPVIGGYVRTLIRVQVSGHDRLAAGPIARTDDRGVYRIGGLRPAEYILSVPSVQSAVPADAPESIMARRRNSPVEEGSGASLGDSTVRTDPEARLVVGQYATPPPPDRNGALTYPTLFYPGARRLSDAIAIPLEAGQERAGIDFRLTPLRAWRVSGLVQPPSGPVEGVTLRLVAEGMQDLGAGAEMGTARTDRNGRFVFLNVPTGRYLLDVRPFSMEYRLAATDANRTASLPSTPATTLSGSAGGVIGSGSSAISYAFSSWRVPSLWGRLSVDVDQGDIEGLRLRLEPTTSVSGRIIFDDTRGTEEPRAASRLRVQAEPADGDPSLGAHSTWATARSGSSELTFSLAGLVPGAYVLRALGGRSIKRIVSNGLDRTGRPIEISSGSGSIDVTITLTSESAILSGTVQQPGAGSVPAAVIVFPVERSEWSDYGWQPTRLRAAPVSANGRYELRLPAGSYFVVAVAEGLARRLLDRRFLAAAVPLATRISLDWGSARTVNLKVTDVR